MTRLQIGVQHAWLIARKKRQRAARHPKARHRMAAELGRGAVRPRRHHLVGTLGLLLRSGEQIAMHGDSGCGAYEANARHALRH
jgi:hypothetical protein